MQELRSFPRTRGGVGESLARPDAAAKVQGDFQFASDLSAPGMLFGQTLRSPHPRAVVRSIAIPNGPLPGVRAVLTAADLPAARTYGLEHRDQPVLVGIGEEVRYRGEAVALVAAEHPEQARAAAAAIRVEYEELEPLTDPVEALVRGQTLRSLVVRRGDPGASAEVVVDGYYEVGQQDQAPLGPEAGLAVSGPDGSVDLWVASQGLHIDLAQVIDCLGLPKDKVRLHLAGVGGAFGAREDLSVHVHACLPALRTGRPVKMWYGREESFVGHVHRHPAGMWYSTGAGRDGSLVFVRATILLDGGAYVSSSPAVVGNAAVFAPGPYRVPNALIWCGAARTNSVPNGAMRGFGAVQVCFAHESQMDQLAAALGMDPLQLRLKNVLQRGEWLATGQKLTGTAPVAELVRRLYEMPLPPTRVPGLGLPGGVGNVVEPQHVRRGIGYALGWKNIAYSGGSDDFATARVRLEQRGGRALATVTTAAAEVGQGLVTVVQQIVRTELGVEEVLLEPSDTSIGGAGSSSASRQTWMTGGAVREAARQVAEEVLRRAGPFAHRMAGGHVVDLEGAALVPIGKLLKEPIERTFEHHHRQTQPLDSDGQGDAIVSFMFVAQRAVVDADPEAGLARVVHVATVQDIGKAINPLQVRGQIEGGVAQGVGLATMEEIVSGGGHIRNPSFTDYLLPTALDMPEVTSVLVEEPEPEGPYGAKGVGEPSVISSPAAIAAALRHASGRRLNRIPVRPDELAGLAQCLPPRQVEPGEAPR